jgi:hypothetical protein
MFLKLVQYFQPSKINWKASTIASLLRMCVRVNFPAALQSHSYTYVLLYTVLSLIQNVLYPSLPLNKEINASKKK